MAQAKASRNRRQSPGYVRRPKTQLRSTAERIRPPKRGSQIPPELRAPITGDVERQLEELLDRFDEKKVDEALAPLVTKCKWNDWQCVANAIRRIARRKLS